MLPLLRPSLIEAAAVINFAERVEFANQIEPAAFFLNPFVRVGRVAQNKKIEALELAGFFERFISGAQPFVNAHDIFIVNRKNDGRAYAVNFLVAVIFQLRDAAARAECPQKKSEDAVHAADGREQK